MVSNLHAHRCELLDCYHHVLYVSPSVVEDIWNVCDYKLNGRGIANDIHVPKHLDSDSFRIFRPQEERSSSRVVAAYTSPRSSSS